VLTPKPSVSVSIADGYIGDTDNVVQSITDLITSTLGTSNVAWSIERVNALYFKENA